MSEIVQPALAFLIAFAAASTGTCILIPWLNRNGFMASPNERSNHRVATPVGGGIAVVAAFVGTFFIMDLTSLPLPSGVATIVSLAIVLAVVSWIDDLRQLGPFIRLSFHALCVAVGSSALPDGSSICSAFPAWLDRVLVCLLWVYFTNIFNFMDGIDGIAGVHTLTISCGVVGSALLNAVPNALGFFCVPIAGATLGFLRYNWHPARIFMGDVGAIPLGYLLGFILLSTAATSSWYPALILPLYILTDATVTLTKRALKRERVWTAHRQHAYQRAAYNIGRHDVVTRAVAIASLGLVASALIFAATASIWLPLATAVGVVALLLLQLEYFSRIRR